LFSRVIVLAYIPTSSVWAFLFLHILIGGFLVDSCPVRSELELGMITPLNGGNQRSCKNKQQKTEEAKIWGQVGWELGWKHTTLCFLSLLISFFKLIFSLSLFFKALLLYNSLKPCFLSLLFYSLSPYN
jgi:hypothetical protein